MISARTMTRVGHPYSFPDPPGMWIGGIASLYWLKRNFGGGLEDSRLLGACDPAKGGGAEHICGGVAEVRVVENVEGLKPEGQGKLLIQREAAAQGGINVEELRTYEAVSWGVSKGSGRVLREFGDVKRVWIDAKSCAGVGVSVEVDVAADEVWPVRSECRHREVLSGGDGEGCTGGCADDGSDLPVIDCEGLPTGEREVAGSYDGGVEDAAAIEFAGRVVALYVVCILYGNAIEGPGVVE